MKISNETKVGLLTIVSLVILIFGFNYLKGSDLFNRSNKIYMEFQNLQGLAKSNEVKVNGYVIGKVYNLTAKDKTLSSYVVTINLTEDVNLPKDSKGYISSPTLGSAYIAIEKGTNTAYIKSGDTLQTIVHAGLLDNVTSQVNPTLAKLREGIDTMKLLLSNANKMFTDGARENLHQTLANLSQSTNALNKLLDNQTGPLAKALSNVNSITENLRNNNDSITAIISGAKRTTDKLSRLDLQPTIDTLNQAMIEFKRAVARINSKDGTLGALINDRALYDRLQDVMLGVEILVDDLRVHPKRYTGSLIFNRKDKTGPLTSPAKKDSIPEGN
jgi:phospholipid/cholesterol/gamma-HCH transport system substrate-binding protein